MVRSTGDSDKEEQVIGNSKLQAQIEGNDAKNTESEPQEQGNGDEEEEEYEIEAIVDAARGRFPAGRIGYFVKWKNYSEEHNSWVDERDAGNAEDLIKEYWRKLKKDKKVTTKKADPLAPKSATKAGRTSIAKDSTSGSASVQKRSRKQADNSDQDIVDTTKTGTEQRVKKRPRKSGAKAQEVQKEPKGDGGDKDDDNVFGDMSRFMTVPDWENIVGTIDTVENTPQGLVVYFTLATTNERIRASSSLIGQRCPQKLLQFYESNLRWKEAEEPDTEIERVENE